MNSCAPRWRGSAPRSSEIEPAGCSGDRNPPLPQLSFQASEGFFSQTLGVNAPFRGLFMITRRAFTAALSLTGLGLFAGFSAGFSPLRLISDAMIPDAMAQGAADVAKPQSLPDMGLGPANAVGDHHRIRLDDLPALRRFHRERVSEDQVGIHRHRQDPLRVPRIPARHQGGRRLDAGALHRQGRRTGNISPSSTSCSSSRTSGW